MSDNKRANCNICGFEITITEPFTGHVLCPNCHTVVIYNSNKSALTEITANSKSTTPP